MPKEPSAEARGLLFDSVAGEYDRVRPDYPAALVAAWREVLPEAATWKPRDAETLWAGVEARESGRR